MNRCCNQPGLVMADATTVLGSRSAKVLERIIEYLLAEAPETSEPNGTRNSRYDYKLQLKHELFEGQKNFRIYMLRVSPHPLIAQDRG